MGWKRYILPLLPQILRLISTPVADSIRKFVDDLQKEAEKTDNPWDDFMVDIVRWILLQGKNDK